MAFDARSRKAGQIRVVEGDGVIDVVSKTAKPRAQDEPQAWGGVDFAPADGLDCLVDRIDRLPSSFLVHEIEGIGQKLAQCQCLAMTFRAAEMDLEIRACKFCKALAAAAARSTKPVASGDHGGFHDFALACSNHCGDRARLGTIAYGISGVLDIGTDINRA